MTSPILALLGEDLSTNALGGGIWTADQTAGGFRPGFCRCAFSSAGGAFYYLTNLLPFSSSSFWTSSWLRFDGSSDTRGDAQPLRWRDSSGVVRLRLRCIGYNQPNLDLFVLEKLTAAGAVIQLGVVSSAGVSSAVSVLDKLDVFIDYAVAGSVQVYRTSAAGTHSQLLSYSGDVTTESTTALAYADFASLGFGGYFHTTRWSEGMVATFDTSSCGLVVQAPSASGVDTGWGGSASNVNSVTNNDSSPDTAATDGLVQGYQVAPALPSAAGVVLGVVHHTRCAVGLSGPQHIQAMVRTHGADYFSPDLTPSSVLNTVEYAWDINPATSAAWTLADLASGSDTFNVGYKATA